LSAAASRIVLAFADIACDIALALSGAWAIGRIICALALATDAGIAAGIRLHGVLLAAFLVSADFGAVRVICDGRSVSSVSRTGLADFADVALSDFEAAALSLPAAVAGEAQR
jgi:hypothetical protein